jgi:multidrug efflux system outer membrane protein
VTAAPLTVRFRCASYFAIFLLGLDGCSVAPTYRQPVQAVPSSWRNQAPVASDWPSADWWKGFGSAQLNDLMDEARISNDDIAAAVARVQQADAQLRIAGAALLPAVSLGATASRQRQLGAASGRATIYNLYSPQLTASYELDFWGKNRSARDAALAAAQASRFDRATIALTVYTSVALIYFEALEAHDRLQVAQDNLTNAQHVLDGLELQQKVGVATALDVAQQATTVATVNASIPPLARQLQQNNDALAILIGRSPESLKVDVDTGLNQLTPPAVIAGMPSELLARRPDVAGAEAQLREANANIGVARAALFPSFDLTAGGGFASTMLSNLLTPQSRVFALSASVTQSIFDAGARSGQIAFSHARYRELLADYHKTVLSAFGNVEDALVAVQQSAEQELRQQDAVNKARRAFEFAQLQMQAGTTNVLTELNTETALFTAQDALVQVKFQYLQALLDLYQALGGGWRAQEPES